MRTDTAGATYEFYVCTQLEEKGEMQLGMLSGQRSFDRYCPDAEPVRDGTRLRTAGSPRQQLVKRGTQLIGPRVRITSG